MTNQTFRVDNKIITCRYCGKEHTILDKGFDSYYEGWSHNRETGDNLLYMGYYENVTWATPLESGLPAGLVTQNAFGDEDLVLKPGDWLWHKPDDSNRHPYWEQLKEEKVLPGAFNTIYARNTTTSA